MGDGVNPAPARGTATSTIWSADCKDCRAERAAAAARQQHGGKGGKPKGRVVFEYSGGWARRKLERGESRSDRCERHRRDHATKIRPFAVPYVDLKVIGQVADTHHPTGPLGGLGPLPVSHQESPPQETDLAAHPFGMTDADILELLDGLKPNGDKTKRVAIVEAGTGTGKSTFMPFRLANPPEGAAWRPTDNGPIIVTEPRRAAAIKVALFVGETLGNGCDSETCNRHTGPGFQVGYQVRGERYWDGACELIYATDGTVINWIRDGALARHSVVIIDEAHERNENIDVILAQLRQALRKNDHLRVIITSATLDRDFFLSFFGGPDAVFEMAVPATKSFGYGTPFFIGTEITDKVLEDGLQIAPDLVFPGWVDEVPAGSQEDESLRTTSRALAKLRCVKDIPTERWGKDMTGAVATQVLAIAKGTDWGDILAFLPVSRMIDRAVDRIKDGLEAAGLTFDVYPLLASTKPEIADRAIAARKRGDKRRIVVSSNLAETSMTVKGVRFVVDSGLICQEEYDPALVRSSLPVKKHSQSALRQRWGRVGRDMPGWVFPLYTQAQYLSLPRNTPPEACRKNLESFRMKLIASGVDPEEGPLPGGHVGDEDRLDEAGREDLKRFRLEIERARSALILAGAIDPDGHMTGFGREIERFGGDGASALATMLGDQLACVHEVILALNVLGGRSLVGVRTENRKDDFLLAIDERWPASWRVRAAQAHRGLALGCRDELDLLLRVVALHESVPDRNAWCARWWVNSAMVTASIEAMMEQVDRLSPAMKQEARRPINPALADRARAVLSRAMVSARYRRGADGLYRADHGADEEEEAKLGANVLVAAPDRLIAMGRDRRGAAPAGTTAPAEISHIVDFLPWAAIDGAGSDQLVLDLILRVAAHKDNSPQDKDQRARTLLDLAPIGMLVDLEIGTRGAIRTFTSVAAPFAGPAATIPTTSIGPRDNESGFDRDWDPRGGKSLGEEPEEERRQTILKTYNLETNDQKPTAPPARKERDATRPPELGALKCRTTRGTEPPAGAIRAFIAGYDQQEDGKFILIADAVAPDYDIAEPGRHPDILPWEEVQLIVAETPTDHRSAFLQLDRADGRGSFHLPDWGSGPGPHDRDFIARLKPGSSLVARAVPTPHDGMTVTLLPLVRAQLAQAPLQTRPSKDGKVRVWAATVLGEPNEHGWASLELEQKDVKTGLSVRLGARRADLEYRGVKAPFTGARLFVALKPLREGENKAAEREEAGRALQAVIDAPNEALAEHAAKLPGLKLTGRKIHASDGDLPFSTIAKLVALFTSGQWRQNVWNFYAQSLHLSVAAVYADSSRIDVPVRVATLVYRNQEALEGRLGVTLFASSKEAFVDVDGPEKKTEAQAVEALTALAKRPRLSFELGAGKVSWRRIADQYGIDYVCLDSGILTVCGSGETRIEEAVRAVIRPARGEIEFPQEWRGTFFGTAGANIKSASGSTGCTAKSPLEDGRFIVEGPSEAAVRQFFTLAKEAFARGKKDIRLVKTRLANSGTLRRVPDPPRPSQAPVQAAWRATHTDFLAAPPLEHLEKLAGAKSQLPPIEPKSPPAEAIPAKPETPRAPTRKPSSTPAQRAKRPGLSQPKPKSGLLSWIAKLFE